MLKNVQNRAATKSFVKTAIVLAYVSHAVIMVRKLNITVMYAVNVKGCAKIAHVHTSAMSVRYILLPIFAINVQVASVKYIKTVNADIIAMGVQNILIVLMKLFTGAENVITQYTKIAVAHVMQKEDY